MPEKSQIKGYKVSEVTRLRSRLCQQIFKGYKVTEVTKVTHSYAGRFSKVTRFQKLHEVTRPALPADFQRLQCYRSYGSYTWLCQKILKGYKVSEVTRLHSRLCQQIFKGYRVAEVAKVAQGYARRFSKVTRFQKLRGCAEL